MGARPLALGRAFLGESDDVTSIFSNPAALGTLKNWQATSLTGKFLNEVEYVTGAYAFPTAYGTFGIGYVGSGLGITAPIATLEVIDGEYRIVPSSTEASFNYVTRTVLLSWAKKLTANIYGAANLKVLFTSLTGYQTSNADSASGQQLDLSLFYNPERFYTLGLNWQNVLPASWGGLTYGDGYREPLGQLVKVGTKVSLLGDRLALREHKQFKLNLLLDADVSYASRVIPTLFHTGLEFFPTPILALRAGVDQDFVGPGQIANNLTAGLGFTTGGVKFDYAYHQYSELASNTTHYFSLGFSPELRYPRPFTVEQPPNRFISYEDKMLVVGRVEDLANVRVLKIDNVEVMPESGGRFDFYAPLNLKLNLITLEAFDKNGRLLGKQELKGLRLLTFRDLDPVYFAKLPIEYLATLGIVTGYPDGAFEPGGKVTRAEMSALLIRAQGTPEGESSSDFIDLNRDYWAYQYVSRAAEEGIVKGYPDQTFRPQGQITRAEGVAMIVRYARIPHGRVYELPYSDVHGRHWAIGEITAAKEMGLLKYLGDGPFEPDQPLTRGEVAEMLYQTDYVKQEIKKLWGD
ncbi:S-layer homology domain-containing protein [Candidatus Saganbacteria bacterium]|nr:S-layer homology domain-containing protein [Candidatus Saganbacteria bacterium]